MHVIFALLVGSAASIAISGNAVQRDVANASICAQRFRGKGHELLNKTILMQKYINVANEKLRSAAELIGVAHRLVATPDGDDANAADKPKNKKVLRRQNAAMGQTTSEEAKKIWKLMSSKTDDSEWELDQHGGRGSGYRVMEAPAYQDKFGQQRLNPTHDQQAHFNSLSINEKIEKLAESSAKYNEALYALYWASGAFDLFLFILSWMSLQADVDESTSVFTVLNSSTSCREAFAKAMASNLPADLNQSARCIQKDMDKCVMSMFYLDFITAIIEGLQSVFDTAIAFNEFRLNIKETKQAVLLARQGTDEKVKETDVQLHRVLYILCGSETTRDMRICQKVNKVFLKNHPELISQHGAEYFQSLSKERWTQVYGKCVHLYHPKTERRGKIITEETIKPGFLGWKECRKKCDQYGHDQKDISVRCLSYEVSKEAKSKQCLLYQYRSVIRENFNQQLKADPHERFCFVRGML